MKNNSTNKVKESNLGFTIGSGNPQKFPSVYSDNIWDIIKDGTDLSILLGLIGSASQNEINELLANKIINIKPKKNYDVIDQETFDSMTEFEPDFFYYVLEEEDEEPENPDSGGGDYPGIIQGLTLKLLRGTVQGKTLILDNDGELNGNTLVISGELI